MLIHNGLIHYYDKKNVITRAKYWQLIDSVRVKKQICVLTNDETMTRWSHFQQWTSTEHYNIHSNKDEKIKPPRNVKKSK